MVRIFLSISPFGYNWTFAKHCFLKKTGNIFKRYIVLSAIEWLLLEFIENAILLCNNLLTDI